MSSFIPSERHFNSCQAATLNLINNNMLCIPHSLKESFPGFYNKHQRISTDEIKEVFDTLRCLTVLCVSLQYKHAYKGVLDDHIKDQTMILFNDLKIQDNLNSIGLLKALQCIGYQIEIEHLTEIRALTENEQKALFFLSEMQNCLALHVISLMPAYNDEKYAID